jgi:hypothetical protein
MYKHRVLGPWALMAAVIVPLAYPTVAPAQNPFQVRPGLSPVNTALMGRALSFIPPHAMGYNPYFFGAGAFAANTPFAAPTINPYFTGTPFGGNPYAATITSSTLPANPGYDPGGFNNMYSNPYNMNPYYYSESPIGGYMRGYADVTSAITKGLIDEQQSFLMREQVRREKMENQRRAFDNWLYYRDKLPTAEEDRQRDLAMRLRRALNDPPASEIYSGRALNLILDDLARKVGKNGAPQGPPIPLNGDEVVAHLNFTGQENKGNPGILKYASTDENRLPWPSVLTGPKFKPERDLVDTLTRTVYKEAESGRVDAGNLDSMTNAVKKLQQTLSDNILDLTPNQYGEARRFLSDFEDALVLLRQPNARDYFGAKTPKAKTAGDLVQEMLGRGLRFAPATAGDEAAYVAAHRALATYASNATSTVATDKPPEREK